MSDYVAPGPALPIAERPTIDITVESHRRWWQYLIDRNPCFLLSGLSMFAGCFLISREIHATDPSAPGFVRMLIGLVVVLNLYEAAVIGLGLWLARSEELVRDARHLLGLALLLLVDVGFVYHETATADLALGGTIALIAGGLAVVKLMVLTRLAGVRLSVAGALVLSVTLVGLYTMPVGLRFIAADGFLSMPVMMGVWGLLGLIVAGYALPGDWAALDEPRDADHRQLQRLIRAGVILLPIGSLMGHAAIALWVYGNDFALTLLAPLILGAAAVVLRQHIRVGGARPAARAAGVLVSAAVLAAIAPPDALMHTFEGVWPSVSPLRGVMLIAPLLLAWAWWLVGGFFLLGYAGLLAAAAALGHTFALMWQRVMNGGEWIGWALAFVLPDDRLGWGFAGVLLAFVLLAAGGGASWARQRVARQRAEASELLLPFEGLME